MVASFSVVIRCCPSDYSSVVSANPDRQNKYSKLIMKLQSFSTQTATQFLLSSIFTFPRVGGRMSVLFQLQMRKKCTHPPKSPAEFSAGVDLSLKQNNVCPSLPPPAQILYFSTSKTLSQTKIPKGDKRLSKLPVHLICVTQENSFKNTTFLNTKLCTCVI